MRAVAASGNATPQPTRPDGLWLDDVTEGMTFRSGTYEVTRSEIVEFAGRFDPQLFHVDEERSGGTFFGGLAASGWHTAAITMRLLVAAVPVATGIVGTDISLKWPSATRAGDVLHLEVTVSGVTPSRSRPERGNLLLTYETVNQDGDVRQATTGRVVVWRRPVADG